MTTRKTGGLHQPYKGVLLRAVAQDIQLIEIYNILASNPDLDQYIVYLIIF
jgi:hypothetical protein